MHLSALTPQSSKYTAGAITVAEVITMDGVEVIIMDGAIIAIGEIKFRKRCRHKTDIA
jgi:hypothetical protein